jgi:transposase InsO family protein
VRGKKVFTTRPDESALRPDDLVQRDCAAAAPNRLWVADLTSVRTWSGFVYVAFVFDTFSRFICGWQATNHLKNRPCRAHPAERLRRAAPVDPRYTERLEEASIEPSVGGRGDSYDNAMAESVIGLYKTEVIRHEGPWRGLDEVEHATLEWVDWFNHQRLPEPIGYVPPAKFEKEYYRNAASEKDRVLRQTSLQEARGGSLFRWPYGGWRTWQPPGCRMGHG